MSGAYLSIIGVLLSFTSLSTASAVDPRLCDLLLSSRSVDPVYISEWAYGSFLMGPHIGALATYKSGGNFQRAFDFQTPKATLRAEFDPITRQLLQFRLTRTTVVEDPILGEMTIRTQESGNVGSLPLEEQLLDFETKRNELARFFLNPLHLMHLVEQDLIRFEMDWIDLISSFPDSNVNVQFPRESSNPHLIVRDANNFEVTIQIQPQSLQMESIALFMRSDEMKTDVRFDFINAKLPQAAMNYQQYRRARKETRRNKAGSTLRKGNWRDLGH